MNNDKNFVDEKTEIKEAVDYVNSLTSPLKAICYTKKKTRTEKMIWVILFALQLIYTFIIFLVTLSWVNSLIAFVEFPIFLFIIFMFVFFHQSYNNDFMERIIELLFPDKNRKTKDFELFIKVLEKYRFNNIKFFDLFIHQKGYWEGGTYVGLTFQYDFNITYDLFNRVKIFALESFLVAEQRKDEEALENILSPMVQDILNEAVEKYRKFKKIEQDFNENQKKQLEKQIAVDLETYEKRKF